MTLGDIDGTRKECHERGVSVAKVTVHPDYNSETLINDVAMLQLEDPVEYDDHIRPICLPPKSHGSDFNYADMNGKFGNLCV